MSSRRTRDRADRQPESGRCHLAPAVIPHVRMRSPAASLLGRWDWRRRNHPHRRRRRGRLLKKGAARTARRRVRPRLLSDTISHETGRRPMRPAASAARITPADHPGQERAYRPRARLTRDGWRGACCKVSVAGIVSMRRRRRGACASVARSSVVQAFWVYQRTTSSTINEPLPLVSVYPHLELVAVRLQAILCRRSPAARAPPRC